MELQYQVATWILWIVVAFPFIFVVVTHYVTFDVFKSPKVMKH